MLKGILTEIINVEPWTTADMLRMTIEALFQMDISHVIMKYSKTSSMKVLLSENIILN